MSRRTRAVVYFFFSVVSLLLGSMAIFSGATIAAGGFASQPLIFLYGSIAFVVAVAAPILFVVAALYALMFGRCT